MCADEIPTFGTQVQDAQYIPRPGGYAVIVREESQIATVRTPKGLFLPGGAIEGNETAADATIRESLEETGLHITIQGHIGRADELVFKSSVGKHFRKE